MKRHVVTYNGEVIFTGTLFEVAGDLGYHPSTIKKFVNSNKDFHGYVIKCVEQAKPKKEKPKVKIDKKEKHYLEVKERLLVYGNTIFCGDYDYIMDRFDDDKIVVKVVKKHDKNVTKHMPKTYYIITFVKLLKRRRKKKK